MASSAWAGSVRPSPSAPRPLADRLRPAQLEDVVGQDQLLGPDGPIGRMLAAGRFSSILLWGPPGAGRSWSCRPLAVPKEGLRKTG
ncbi:MAG: hypothetical protein AAFQ67_01280, partial [Pseudomonadota bacterium]